MTTAISERIKEVNVLMTIFIVALHVFAWEERMWYLRALVNMAVPVFFVISSYLYFQNWNFSWQCYKKKILRRFYSLYIPFIVYNALYIPYIFIKNNIIHSADTRHLSVFSIDMLTSIFIGLPDIPSPVLWFIRVLLLFSLVAPIIGLMIKYSKWTFVLIIIICLLLSPYFQYASILYWLPCLSLGTLLAFHESDIIIFINQLKQRISRLVFLILFIAFIITISYILRNEDVFTSPYYYYYRMTVPFVVILFYSYFHHLLPSRLVSSILPYTFTIYCMHVPFVNFSVMFISRLIPSQHFIVVQLLSLMIAFTMCLIICILLSHIKPLWTILTGYRNS